MPHGRVRESQIPLQAVHINDHDVIRPGPRNKMPFSARPSARTRTPPNRGRKPRSRWLMLLSYTPDWIISIVLAGVFFGLDNVDNFKRQFSLTDTSLLHPFATHERVPNTALYMIAIIAPFVLQIIINIITIRSWWDFHNGTLGLLLSLCLTGSITQFTKITVGRPRPDIVSRCIPIAGSVDPPLGLSDWTICTQTDVFKLRDGFRSFPSGHASLSFAGLGFLSFYLSGKLHLFDHRGHAGKAWLALTPLSGAALVAISRTMDYRHHWQDVLVGSILGLVLSYFSYRQYFPELTSRLSHRPYEPRHTLENSWDEVVREDQEGAGRHLRHESESSTNDHPLQGPTNGPHRQGSQYRDESIERTDGELEGVAPRNGAQDLTETWREGQGKITDVEAGR